MKHINKSDIKMSEDCIKHGTDHELEFIKKIGTWNQDVRMEKKKLLELYVRALEKRKNWCNINKKKVFDFAMNELIKMK